jgi:hypothetical protein
MDGGFLLRPDHLITIQWAAGDWYRSHRITVVDDAVAERHSVGVYLLADGDRRVLHLGQAHRGDGIGGRIAHHLAHPIRRRTRFVGLVCLDEWTPKEALNAIEGKAAHHLGLRAYLPRDIWPDFSRWAEVTCAARR